MAGKIFSDKRQACLTFRPWSFVRCPKSATLGSPGAENPTSSRRQPCDLLTVPPPPHRGPESGRSPRGAEGRASVCPSGVPAVLASPVPFTPACSASKAQSTIDPGGGRQSPARLSSGRGWAFGEPLRPEVGRRRRPGPYRGGSGLCGAASLDDGLHRSLSPTIFRSCRQVTRADLMLGILPGMRICGSSIYFSV